MTHQLNHSEPAGKHPKQDFQVERIAFFSDAVVAIAITLLILEIKIPHIAKDSTYDQVLDQVGDLKYGFIALFLSFMVISNYWMVHHLLFKHIVNYNRRMLWANMGFLLAIVFFPFTVSLFAVSPENHTVFNFAMKLFILNNVLALFALSAIYWLAFKKYKDFTYRLTPDEEKEVKNDLIFPLIVFSLLFAGSFFTERIEILLVLNLVAVLAKRLYTFVKKKFA